MLHKYRPYSIALILCLLYGGFLRIFSLDTQSLWIDEGYSSNAIMAILQHGYPLLTSGALYTTHVFHSYLSAISGILLGVDEWSLRLPSVLFGTSTIFLTWLYTQQMFRTPLLSLMSALLITVNTWEIAWSRQIRSYAQLQFFFLLSCYFTAKLSSTWSWRYVAYTLISALAAYISHPMGILVFPLIGIQLTIQKRTTILTYLQAQSLRQILWIGTYMFLGITTILSLTYSLGHLQVIWQQLSEIRFHYLRSYTAFFAYEFSIPFFFALIGLLYTYIHPPTRHLTFQIGLWLILPMILIGLFIPLFHVRYLYMVFPFMIILAAYSIYMSSRIWNSQVRQALHTLFAFLLFLPLTTWTPHTHYQLEFGSPQPDFKSAYTFITQEKKPSDVILSPYTPLDMWYLGQTDYWLKFSLTGKQSDLLQYSNATREWYTNTPIIHNLEQLKEITQDTHGYILVDAMFHGHTDGIYHTYLSEHYDLVYSKTISPVDSVWVYRF